MERREEEYRVGSYESRAGRGQEMGIDRFAVMQVMTLAVLRPRGIGVDEYCLSLYACL